MTTRSSRGNASNAARSGSACARGSSFCSASGAGSDTATSAGWGAAGSCVAAGEPSEAASVSMGVYAMALFVLGFGEAIGEIVDPRRDDIGLLLDVDRLPKRVRPKKAPVPWGTMASIIPCSRRNSLV